MGTNEKNMTAGSPGKLIITFAIPLMLGNIFQQFYTMADTMIVGRVVGVEALAAVGAGDWLVWLVLGIMTGITQGFSILVSQYYGAGEKENLKCAVAKSYIMTALLSVIVLAVSEGAVYHVLLFLQTPDNVIDLTMLYLRLIFAGVPIIAAYNIFAAILRALGNSRSPLIAMTVAAVINVGLDLLFVAVFGWGVAGAAVATVIAQGFSALYCLLVLRKIRDIRLEKEDFYRQPSMSLRLLKLGTPLAIQNVIISVGGTYGAVCDQWLWLSVCSRIYGNEQAVWNFGDGSRFLWICDYNVCRAESWRKEISENPKRCAQRYVYGSTHFCFHFRYDGADWT